MFRGLRTFVCNLALAVATVIFVASLGLAIFIYLGGEWSTVAAAIDRGREYLPEYQAPDIEAARTRLANVIAPSGNHPMPNTNADVTADSLRVFFSPVEEARTDGPDDVLLALIGSAKRSIHGAFYDLGYEPLADALIAKHVAGVEVRLVSDSHYEDRDAVRACYAAGIPVEFDDRSAFMHNKFCIVDSEWVWTGSTNVTRNGFFHNNNNAILLQSAEAANRFTTEFNEMFELRSFGARSPESVNRAPIVLADATIEIYFAPEDGVEREIREEIAGADKTLDFMAFAFTSKPIADAMAMRIEHGVQIRGLFETRSAGSRYSKDEYLAKRGATIYLDTNPKAMHHKVIVIDGGTVITGSYNFSKSAEKSNDENVLIVHSPAVAEQFTAEFNRLIGGPH
jgi:phosphatidylserine/phosphatidylglycerophosphate/cardiolipin synthase-like enzyme